MGKKNHPSGTVPRVFISYCVEDKKFVYDVCRVLELFIPTNLYRFEEAPAVHGDFHDQMVREVKHCHAFIAFIGKLPLSRYQFSEILIADADENPEMNRAICIVGIGGQKKTEDFPVEIQNDFYRRHRIRDDFTVTDNGDAAIPPNSLGCAKKIIESLRAWMLSYWGISLEWSDSKFVPGLPKTPQLFDYEKDIIEFYAAKRFYEMENAATSNEQRSAVEKERNRLANALAVWTRDKIEERHRAGVPGEWPKVVRYTHPRTNHLNPASVGDFRVGEDGADAFVRVAALPRIEPYGEPLAFYEAGPRTMLALPRPGENVLNVAILVAGGISPGINAVIDAIVQRHSAYHVAAGEHQENYALNIKGIKNGLLAFRGPALHHHLRDLKPNDTIEYATRGGSMLGTSRDDDLLNLQLRSSRLRDIAIKLSNEGVDLLYIIGGDGTMKVAHALWTIANLNPPDAPWANRANARNPMSVIAVPKTMDNDVLWVWQSFGFLSAVDESRQIVETLHTEVRSNPRLGIVQLFGSDSGFVVSHAVLAAAAGHAILALIPEIDFSVIGIARYLKWRLWKSAENYPNSPPYPIDPKFVYGLVVMAETAIPQDALECLGLTNGLDHVTKKYRRIYENVAAKIRLAQGDDEAIKQFIERRRENRRSEGQTSDTLRQLGLRILREALPVFIASNELELGIEEPRCQAPEWSQLRVVCSEPRHLVRSMEPSTSDIITGQRLGLLAVDAAMAGFTDCMVSQWLTEFALVPLELAVLGRKRIPAKGMFWKSVTAKTGQWANLVAPYHHPQAAEPQGDPISENAVRT
jgi:6-phosphofructokinase